MIICSSGLTEVIEFPLESAIELIVGLAKETFPTSKLRIKTIMMINILIEDRERIAFTFSF